MSKLRNILSGVSASLADQTLAVLRIRYKDEGPPGGWDTLNSSVAGFVSYVQDVRRRERAVTDLADVMDVRELRMTEVRVRRAMWVIAPNVTQFSHIVDGMVYDDMTQPSLPRCDAKCPEAKLPQRFFFDPWQGGPLEVALVDCTWFHHTNGTAVAMFTRRASGSSCLALCMYNDFFYVELAEGVAPEALRSEIENVCGDLRLSSSSTDPAGMDVVRPYIVSIETTRRMSRMDEFSAEKKVYLKVTTSSPLVTRRVTGLLKHKFKDHACPLFFNTDEDLADKFLNEKGLASGDVVTLAEVESMHMNVYSSCDEVVMCQSAARVDKDCATSPVVMYYEATALLGVNKSTSPCCQISYLVVYNEKVLHEGSLCLGPSRAYEWYPYEEQVITRFAQIVTASDPDFLVCCGRDNANMVYLMERMEMLGIEGFATQLSKRLGHCVSVTTKNAYYGCVSRNVFDCPGRAIVNLADLIKKNNKEVSGMSLRELAKKVGIVEDDGPQEEFDFFHQRDLFQRQAADRVHLIRKLDEATTSTYSVWSMAQVLRMSVSSYLAVGVSGHVMARMRAACAERNFVVSHGAQRSKGDHVAVGGNVIEPEPKYHTDPVVVIDFASMYPSIIRAYNICVSTILDEKVHEEFMLDFPNAFVRINGVCFVKQETLIGLVPCILRGLGEERARLRSSMRDEPKDSFRYKALNARQLACKVTMNAFYGVGGNSKLPMYHPLVARTIASKGQALLDQAVVEVKDAGEVIYGDTDSVFVKMRDMDVDAALDRGRALARDINELMTSPIRIELECAYKPFLIQGKKRYCGAKYVSSGRESPSVEIKGLNGVSSNKPPFASNMLRRYLDEILLNDDEVAAFEVVRTAVTKLFASEFSAKELSLSNVVNKNSEDYRKGKPSFFKALERMRERHGVLRSPCLGERFFYVRSTLEGPFDDTEHASCSGESYPYDLKKYFRTDVVETMQTIMNLVHDEAEVSKLLSIDSYNILATKRKAHPGSILTYFKNKKPTPLSEFKYSA